VIGIVVSRADRASEHIGEQLLELAEWEQVEPGVFERPGFELRVFDALNLELDGVAEAFGDPSFVVFPSRHSGDTGPLLSAHFTGNFGDAPYGGSERELSVPAPNALRRALNALADVAPPAYDVAMECTHHGPSDHGAPGLFVEVGSDEPQWNDPDGARAAAKAILSLEGVHPFSDRTLVAFGGNHYAPRPTRIVSETEFAVGHVAADWSLEELGDPAAHRDQVESMFAKSGAECAIVDGDLPAIESVVADLGYRIVSETWVRETSGYDPALVEAVESALGTVDEGVRFGEMVPETESFEVVALPEGLLDECHGIDAPATVAAVGVEAIAYQTDENGNLVGSRAALPDRAALERIVEGLCSVLRQSYDTVQREGEEIVAERTAFDPERAADLGVPEGPKFGQLAGGQSVTVDGEPIEPETVHVTEIRRFDV
jgi:D-aminoacyl-tRNA deacylase